MTAILIGVFWDVRTLYLNLATEHIYYTLYFSLSTLIHKLKISHYVAVVSFTPRPFYPRWKRPRYPLDRRLSGLQIQYGPCGEQKKFVLAGNGTPAHHLIAHRCTNWDISALSGLNTNWKMMHRIVLQWRLKAEILRRDIRNDVGYITCYYKHKPLGLCYGFLCCLCVFSLFYPSHIIHMSQLSFLLIFCFNIMENDLLISAVCELRRGIPIIGPYLGWIVHSVTISTARLR
jgi:hypothetical protein